MLGASEIAASGYALAFYHEDGARRLSFHMDRFRGKDAIEGIITLTDEPDESLVIATPFEKPGHFYYNQKINCLRASGWVELGAERFELTPDKIFAVLDWGRGVWTYHNTWYWSSASGLLDGAPFGWNLGYGFGDTSAALTDSITGEFTLANLASMGTYLPIFLRSIWLSLFASLICLVIGYPVAYFIAQCKPLTQRFLEMLIMLPMCMSFLLRTLAWVAMLEDTGIINNFIRALGLSPLPLIRNNGAVILGMVYNYLPYMILPVYTVIMKIDKRLVEAALDLGCTPKQVFTKVVLPLSGPGILSGLTMVFVPAVSTFYISQKLGSTGTTLIGDVIESQFKTAYNPNLGAAMSLVLMILIFVCVSIMNRFGETDEEEVMAKV